MSHSMRLSLDQSDRLLATQREIHYLYTRLADIEDTLCSHQRMQAGQDNDFYSLDQDTRTATSFEVGTSEELPVDSRLQSDSRLC
jgi:hypothetical protein